MQLCTGVPSTWTVQAPQSPPSQPFLDAEVALFAQEGAQALARARLRPSVAGSVDLDGHAQASFCCSVLNDSAWVDGCGEVACGGQKSPETVSGPSPEPGSHSSARISSASRYVMSRRHSGSPWMSSWYSSVGDGGVKCPTAAASWPCVRQRPPSAEAQLHGPFGGGGDGEDQAAVGVEPSDQQHPGPARGCSARAGGRPPGPPRADAGRLDAAQQLAGCQAVLPVPDHELGHRHGPAAAAPGQGWWPCASKRGTQRNHRPGRAARCRGCRPPWTCSRP